MVQFLFLIFQLIIVLVLCEDEVDKKGKGIEVSSVGECPPQYPFPSHNNPNACCQQFNKDYCGSGRCCDIGWCSRSPCCMCDCPPPTCEKCSTTSSGSSVCCEDENVCSDDDSCTGKIGSRPKCCTEPTLFCDDGDTFSCLPIPSCIWDYPRCALPGPWIPGPIDPTPFHDCESNPSSCTKITGRNCANFPIDFLVKKSDCPKFRLQVTTFAKSSANEKRTLTFPDNCIPPNWVKMEKSECPNVVMSEVITDVKIETLGVIPDKIYRVLRANEIINGPNGEFNVHPKDSLKQYKVAYHITSGTLHNTQYLSASTDFATNWAYCNKLTEKGRDYLVEFSVTKLRAGGCNVLDVSSGEGLKKSRKRKRKSMAHNFAGFEKEVLICGNKIKDYVWGPCASATAAITGYYKCKF